MEHLEKQRVALGQVKDLLRQFVRHDCEVQEFLPAYRALFAPFDPPDLMAQALSPQERRELEVYIRLMGGWFGEDDALLPRVQDWTYGANSAMYSWIDGAAYRQWILKATRDVGVVLDESGQ